eukprot:jgi/Picre1/31773/NNA_007123.t1
MWKYQELLNQNLQILITIGLGALVTWLGPFSVKKDLPTLVKIVFNILLPSAVLLALGVNSDLRDGDLWRFIGGFLLLRAFCLVLNFGYYGCIRKRSIAYVTINWMVTCWVSTVVLGIPLLIATLVPQYGSLGAVAGISSFIFQLPLMLIFFEGSSGTRGVHERQQKGSEENGSEKNIETKQLSDLPKERDVEGEEKTDQSAADVVARGDAGDNSNHWYHVRLTKAQAQYIAVKILRNPILWAIVIGIILSVSSLGPKYLATGSPNSPNCSYAVGAGFIQLTLSYFARCTQPIALLAVGLMVGCAFAVGLQGAEGRAAVLLASLPVSPTAYTVADKYGVGLDIAESNIFFGNLLVLPTTIAWNAFMDSISLFMAPAPPSVTSGC